MKSLFTEGGWFLLPDPEDAISEEGLTGDVINTSRMLIGHAIAACLGPGNYDVKVLEEELRPNPYDQEDSIDVLEVVVLRNGIQLQLPIRQSNQEANLSIISTQVTPAEHLLPQAV